MIVSPSAKTRSSLCLTRGRYEVTARWTSPLTIDDAADESAVAAGVDLTFVRRTYEIGKVLKSSTVF